MSPEDLKNRLEIALKEANDKPVSLMSMSSDAVESFVTVVSSLKSIVVSLVSADEVTFSISEGSASFAVEASSAKMDQIYVNLDLAIQGKSDNKEVTDHLRKIQAQIKRKAFNYDFRYNKPKVNIEIHPRLFEANRITIKRKDRLPYEFKLKVVRGFLNQIGGKEPNYHFDYGQGDKITIDCTMNDAKTINKYLYQNVASLLLCKEWKKKEKRSEFTHKVILDDVMADYFSKYLKKYNSEKELVKKLTVTHDFIDEMFEKSKDGHKALNCLLTAFNDKKFYLSELKTMLVISKPFKHHEIIKVSRLSLLETYHKKKINA